MPTKTVKTTGTNGTEETKEVEKKEDELSFIEKDVLKREVNNYVNRLAKYKDNKNRIYSLILGQCTTGMVAKLKLLKNWEDIKDSKDPVWLLKAIKSIAGGFQDNRYPMASIYDALMSVMQIERDPQKESLVHCTKRYQNQRDLMESQVGKMALVPCVKR